jgi:hypothetical protein
MVIVLLEYARVLSMANRSLLLPSRTRLAILLQTWMHLIQASASFVACAATVHRVRVLILSLLELRGKLCYSGRNRLLSQ